MGNLPPVLLLEVVLAALFGLIFGSFLNVCIVRLPRGESIVQPPSHCRSCGMPVRPVDNLPVISWLLLRGRARCCGQPVALLYPMVEAACAILFAVCILQYGFTTAGAGFAVLCWLLLGLAVMDAQTYLLPDLFTVPGAMLGIVFMVAAAPAGRVAAACHALLSAAAVGGFLLAVALVYKGVRRRDGMGMGDVKLGALLGAWLGWKLGAVALFLAVLGGAAAGIFVMLRRGGRAGSGRDSINGALRIPFGTFLAAGGIVAVFAGRPMLAWYLRWFV